MGSLSHFLRKPSFPPSAPLVVWRKPRPPPAIRHGRSQPAPLLQVSHSSWLCRRRHRVLWGFIFLSFACVGTCGGGGACWSCRGGTEVLRATEMFSWAFARCMIFMPCPAPSTLQPPLGQVDSLMLWAAFVICSFLPQFSKGSDDVSGLAPTLSINQFKSNKRGIFSRTCVHSPCLTVEQGFLFLLGQGLSFVALFFPFFPSVFLFLYERSVWEFHRSPSTPLPPDFWTRHFNPCNFFFLHSPLSALAPPCPPFWLSICATSKRLPPFSRCCWINRKVLFQKLLAFVCGIIKNAPQLGVWFLSPC